MSAEVVAKYGGTSMAQPELVAEIVESRSDQQIIVVSAPGKHPETGITEKITDRLLAYADGLNAPGQATDIRDEVIDRFDSLYYSNLGSNDRAELKDTAYGLLSTASNRIDRFAISAIGEELSAHFFARMIGAKVFKPNWIRMGVEGKVDRTMTQQLFGRAYSEVAEQPKLIVPGYYGYNKHNEIVALARGGSDRTGALAAVALDSLLADDVVYENWTDTDGIYSADPNKIPAAQFIPVLTRAEVREGAHGGSGILQGDTIVDLNGSSIAVIVRNTNNPTAQGTRIELARDVDPDQPVVSVTGKLLLAVTVQDMGMADQRGYMAEVAHIVDENGLSIEHSPTAHDALTFTFENTDDNKEKVHSFMSDVQAVLTTGTASVNFETKGVVYLVGEALRQSPVLTRVIGRTVGVLLEDREMRDGKVVSGKGFETIVSHPHSPSLALLIAPSTLDSAQERLHQEFIG
jgi:aspartate kinase